jgi:biotin carboxyl carrier protein
MSELKVAIENGKTYTIENLSRGKSLVDQEELSWDSLKIKEGKFHILKNNQSYNAEVVAANYSTKTFSIKVNGQEYAVKVEDRFDLLLQQLGMDDLEAAGVTELKAPMPGLVLKIEVEVGQEIAKDQPIVVLEAMKMENVLKSPADLTVKNIAVSQGQAVEKNQIIIEFES